MADVIPGELEKTPMADTSVNKPVSGTYGEKAALDRLQQQFPTEGAPSPEGAAPLTPSPGRPFQGGSPGRPPNAPAGVPDVLMGPTNTNTPLNTPLVRPSETPAGPLGGSGTLSEARIALLQSLASDPEVSTDTQVWAKWLLEVLGAG